MFVYSGSSGVLLTDRRNDNIYGNLIDHFYVSSTNHSGTAAVPYLTQTYGKSSNATVFFVEKFGNIDGELFWIWWVEFSELSWVELMKKLEI